MPHYTLPSPPALTNLWQHYLGRSTFASSSLLYLSFHVILSLTERGLHVTWALFQKWGLFRKKTWRQYFKKEAVPCMLSNLVHKYFMPEDFLDFRWISLIAAWIFNYSPTRKLWQGHGRRREEFDGKGRVNRPTRRDPSKVVKNHHCAQTNHVLSAESLFWITTDFLKYFLRLRRCRYHYTLLAAAARYAAPCSTLQLVPVVGLSRTE